VTDPTGNIVRNIFTLRRLENGIAAEVDQLLQALFDDIVQQLTRIDPTGVGAETFRRGRIEKLMAEVEALSGKAFDEVQKLVRGRSAQVGAMQADFAENQLKSTLGRAGAVVVDVRPNRIGINMMKSIIDTDPMQGHLLKDWFTGQNRGTVFRVRQQIQLGMAQGETIDDMVRRIRGRQVGFRRRGPGGQFVPAGTRGAQLERIFSGGVMDTTSREARGIVRTAVNHIANEAHLRTYESNGDITETYTYTATLDSRTSEICMSLDGQVFRYDDPEGRRPPQHINCRSTIVPNVKWDELGLEPPEEGTRASADGQVPSSTTYEDWLRNQPREIQDEILGPSKAKLFRDGKIDLRDLVRKDNSIVTVDELKKKAGASGGGTSGAGGAVSSGDEPLRSSLGKVEDQIRNRSNEWAVIVDEAGDEVFRKTSNSPSFVNFTPDEVAKFKDGFFTHNHPSSSSFSPADISFAIANDLAEMRVASKRADYRLTRPQGGWQNELRQRIGDVIGEADSEARSELDPLVSTGEMSTDEANFEFWHRVWDKVDTKLTEKFGETYFLDYVRRILT